MSLDENRLLRELSPSMDAKAIFLQLTRMWTTHGVGNSQSMDARAFLGTVRESLANLGQMNGLGVLRQLDCRTAQVWDRPLFALEQLSTVLAATY
jgi:hypothetical protein